MGGGELSIEERSVQALALAKALAGALSIEEKNALVERVTAQFICQDRMKLWDQGGYNVLHRRTRRRTL